MLKDKYLIIFVLALIPLLAFANEQSNGYVKHNLENCLIEYYHIDHKSLDIILSKFNPLIEDVSTHYIINEFIKKSENINIDFTTNKSIEFLSSDDAILQAPDWHKILFESNYVRVFLGHSTPGECEPYHLHQWNRIMVMLQDATFKIENADGSIEIDTWPMGIYELPPDTTSSAYTNIGTTEFIALIFEVKG